nr:hypothetical protein [uncultured Lichenicoccus sp.]
MVDKTAVGAPVADAMREMGVAPIAVSITGGRVANMNDSANYTVPKSMLASMLDMVLAEERLEITEAVGASEPLRLKLQNSHAKVTADCVTLARGLAGGSP